MAALATAPAGVASQAGGRPAERIAAPRVGLLIGLTMLAVVPRLTVLVQSARLGADEAVEGLMAWHILRLGELPVFFWGQDYFGAAEAYLVAGLFALGGFQPWLVCIPALVASLTLVPLVWVLAEHLGPWPSGVLAALPLAVPTPVLSRLLGNAGGGFALGLVLEYGALLCLLRGRLSAFSLLVGLAIWVWQPTLLAVPLLLAYAVLRRDRGRIWQLAPIVVGLLPILVYNLARNWPTLTALLIKFSQQHEMEIDPVQLTIAALGGGDEWIAGANTAQALLVGIAYVLQPVLALLLVPGRARVTLLVIGVAGLNVLAAHGSARYLLPATLVGLALGGALLGTLAERLRLGRPMAFALMGVVVGMGTLPAYADINAVMLRDELSRLDETQAAIAALDARGLHLGYADYWTAFPITYLSEERIVVSPALPLVWGRSADRYPPYTRQVAAEDDASRLFLLVDQRCGPGSYVAALDAAGATYRADRVARWLLIWDIHAPPSAVAAALGARATC